MNVEIGAEAALFPEKEYINGFAVAVHYKASIQQRLSGEHVFKTHHALIKIFA